MAQYFSGFFDSAGVTRTYSQADLARAFRSMLCNGVSDLVDCLKVTSGGGMTVKVAAEIAMQEGYFGGILDDGGAALQLTVDAAGTAPRIVRVVLRQALTATDAEQWVGDIRTALTDEDGTCHLLCLPPQLLACGYTLAGVAGSAGVPDTSGWGASYGVSDALLLSAPLLCAVNASASCGYESLHFSPYGYKAIGKLVTEKLGEMVIVSGDHEDPKPDVGYETNVTDTFGDLAFHLTKPKTGIGMLFDTGYTPFDTDKDWTICCKCADNILVVSGALGSIFETYLYFPEEQKVTAVYLRKNIGSDGSLNCTFAGGFGGFDMPRDQYGESTDGYRYAIISKHGDNFDLSSAFPRELRSRCWPSPTRRGGRSPTAGRLAM